MQPTKEAISTPFFESAVGIASTAAVSGFIVFIGLFGIVYMFFRRTKKIRDLDSRVNSKILPVMNRTLEDDAYPSSDEQEDNIHPSDAPNGDTHRSRSYTRGRISTLFASQLSWELSQGFESQGGKISQIAPDSTPTVTGLTTFSSLDNGDQGGDNDEDDASLSVYSDFTSDGDSGDNSSVDGVYSTKPVYRDVLTNAVAEGKGKKEGAKENGNGKKKPT